ncbi:exported hypothetical protein [Verrucomicrobia bacterium]|nr:exported hypothetical protein [Verrucomicrobiota bacterium]
MRTRILLAWVAVGITAGSLAGDTPPSPGAGAPKAAASAPARSSPPLVTGGGGNTTNHLWLRVPLVRLTNDVSRATTNIAPGVYKAFPYTALVLVPGPIPDDGSVITPQGHNSQMPILKPELRLIPRTQTK